MVNGFWKVGTFIFDYLVITILLSISLVLVFPFPFILTGVHKYLCFKFEERRLAVIFETIKENWKILLKFSLFWGVLTGLAVWEVVLFNVGKFDSIPMTVVCYVILVLSVVMITNAPMLIVRMNLTLKQLLFNCITVIYGCWYLCLLAYILTIGYIIGVSFFLYIAPVGIFFLVWYDNFATRKAIKVLKAKALKIKVEEVEEIENKKVSDL